MEKEIPYGSKKKVETGFSETIEKVRRELQKEGFGVLTEIDVKATLKKKLDVDFDDYVILGACNPPLAFKALRSERDIGLMLPCNVIVYREGGSTFVVAISPKVQFSKVGNPELRPVAEDVESRLKRVLERV